MIVNGTSCHLMLVCNHAASWLDDAPYSIPSNQWHHKNQQSSISDITKKLSCTTSFFDLLYGAIMINIKLDDHKFHNHLYDYRPNWTQLSPITIIWWTCCWDVCHLDGNKISAVDFRCCFWVRAGEGLSFTVSTLSSEELTGLFTIILNLYKVHGTATAGHCIWRQ